MREYKYVCKDCKEHLTNSEDRLCEWCRDKKRVNSAQICIICGKRRTPARDGVCYNCRPKVPKEPYKPGVPWKEALKNMSNSRKRNGRHAKCLTILPRICGGHPNLM